jgi:hypothetical protein
MRRLLMVLSLEILMGGALFGAYTIAVAGDVTSNVRAVAEVARERKSSREPLFNPHSMPSFAADYRPSSVPDVPPFGSDIEETEQPADAASESLDTSILPDIDDVQTYLIATAQPGSTMTRQGPALAIGRLHPEFAARLARAIHQARDSGLSSAGIFSAYRPPAFGIGGFSDKFNSLHTYGLAVDMHGIGRPGSAETKLWREIAARNGIVCPYAAASHAEWNHCQPTRVKIIRPQNPLREMVTADGPLSLSGMFEVGNALIEDPETMEASLASDASANAARDTAVAKPLRPRVFAAQRASRQRAGRGRPAALAKMHAGRKPGRAKYDLVLIRPGRIILAEAKGGRAQSRARRVSASRHMKHRRSFTDVGLPPQGHAMYAPAGAADAIRPEFV